VPINSLQKTNVLFSKVVGYVLQLRDYPYYICKFYECSDGKKLMQWELILE